MDAVLVFVTKRPSRSSNVFREALTRSFNIPAGRVRLGEQVDLLERRVPFNIPVPLAGTEGRDNDGYSNREASGILLA